MAAFTKSKELMQLREKQEGEKRRNIGVSKFFKIFYQK